LRASSRLDGVVGKSPTGVSGFFLDANVFIGYDVAKSSEFDPFLGRRVQVPGTASQYHIPEARLPRGTIPGMAAGH
jgi:hypothetical protein